MLLKSFYYPKTEPKPQDLLQSFRNGGISAERSSPILTKFKVRFHFAICIKTCSKRPRNAKTEGRSWLPKKFASLTVMIPGP